MTTPNEPKKVEEPQKLTPEEESRLLELAQQAADLEDAIEDADRIVITPTDVFIIGKKPEG